MIRPLQPNDAEQIAPIIETHVRAMSPGSPKWQPDQVRAECRGAGFVKESEGQIEAFILYREQVDAWEITYLATAGNALRKGCMKALLGHMISQMPKDKAIWLEVHAENQLALRLYEGLGFREVGRRPKYYADGAAAILYSLGDHS